jgi:hypothetical protein
MVMVRPYQPSYYPSDFFSKKAKKDTCIVLLVDASAFYYNYIKTRDVFFFDEGIKLIDSALKMCYNKWDILDSKFEFYVLQKSCTENVIDWFSRLDSTYYFDDFQKIFYVNTLKSLFFDSVGDTVSRDSVNKEIVIFIEEHVFCCPSNFNWQQNFMQHNKKMFATYYYVRGRYEDINLLKEELQACCINKENDNQEDIEEIIFMLDSMNKKSYHFEY